MNPNEQKNTEKPLSVREQLDLLKKEQDGETKDFETISERMEEKKDKNPFDEFNEEKSPKMNKKVKIIMISVFAAVLVLVGVVVFLNQNNSQNDKQTNISPTDKISDNAKTSGSTKGDSEHRLPLPTESTKTKEGMVENVNQIQEMMVKYLTEIKDTVIEYNNRERNDIYIEDIMKPYKSSLLQDIDIFAKYKPIYEKYQASDLYLVTANRLQNIYELARTSKNVMTEKALVANTNSYIEIENELNTRAKTSLILLLENNNIEFFVEGDNIKYSLN
ncbi:MAG: hypothetical protein RSC93_02490 [Erysipelotrichaceae bacterium]